MSRSYHKMLCGLLGGQVLLFDFPWSIFRQKVWQRHGYHHRYFGSVFAVCCAARGVFIIRYYYSDHENCKNQLQYISSTVSARCKIFGFCQQGIRLSFRRAEIEEQKQSARQSYRCVRICLIDCHNYISNNKCSKYLDFRFYSSAWLFHQLASNCVPVCSVMI